MNQPSYCQLTTIYYQTILQQINPGLVISSVKRPLTFPFEGKYNYGMDNENNELIIYTDDIITTNEMNKINNKEYERNYKIIQNLGKGTFGQVFRCEELNSQEKYAIKILKNKPTYFRQGMLEIAILINSNKENGNDDKNIVRIIDYFLFKKHICIVTELLGSNLYEIIRMNKNRGMGAAFTQIIGIQILNGINTIRNEGIIHCDLKPENILMVNNKQQKIKLIDLGSGCYEKSPMYSYIQSRHYRAPEIIIGMQYDCAIDMWSYGCCIAELLLGIPIFPGECEYNQLLKIIEMIGMPSKEMLDKGTKTNKYFNKRYDSEGYHYEIKSAEEYFGENGMKIMENKRYHQYKSLKEFCQGIRIHKNGEKHEEDYKMKGKIYDFLQKILVLDPRKRMTPVEASNHVFLRGRKEHDKINIEEKERRKEKSMKMEEVIYRITGGGNEVRHKKYETEEYYYTFKKGIEMGIVLNILNEHPFRLFPVKIYEEYNENNYNEEEDELPGIGIFTNMNDIPMRSRSKSISHINININEELPQIDMLPSIGNENNTKQTSPNYLNNFSPQQSNPLIQEMGRRFSIKSRKGNVYGSTSMNNLQRNTNNNSPITTNLNGREQRNKSRKNSLINYSNL